MGEDKSMLPFGGFDTLLEYQYRRLTALFSEVYISTKKVNLPFTCKIIEDKSEVFAPTAGFVSLFESVKSEAFFVISVDSPFIDDSLIAQIIAQDSDDVDATIVKTDEGLHPLCGIYHRSLQPSFKRMLQEDNHKLGLLLKASTCNYITCNNSHKMMNLNYKSEYLEALKHL